MARRGALKTMAAGLGLLLPHDRQTIEKRLVSHSV